MRIIKWVEIEREIEVDITSEDIRQIYLDDPESLPHVLTAIDNAAQIIMGVPVEMISKMKQGSRELIVGFLENEAARYKAVE